MCFLYTRGRCSMLLADHQNSVIKTDLHRGT
uniref:Uncharacterized protein n=1 Tax=Anguilla anguilla TaxID=7936 RepID=A0A0E9VHA1_ANGAN